MSGSLRPDGKVVPHWHLLDARTRRLFAVLGLAWSVKVIIDLVQRRWTITALDLLLAVGFSVGTLSTSRTKRRLGWITVAAVVVAYWYALAIGAL
jgi:hypothetical protein